MPQLPFAGFTADLSGARPGGAGAVPNVNIPAPVKPKSGVRAQAQFGTELERLGQVILRKEEERESRRVQVESARTAALFGEEIQNAVETGEEFEPVAERSLARFDEVSQGLSTGAGTSNMELARVRMEASFAASIRSAESTRAKSEAATQTQDMLNILGSSVTTNPGTLADATAEMDIFIDSFGNLSEEDRGTLKQSTANGLTVAAANSMLRSNPLDLQEILEAKGSFPDMEPAQRAQFLNRTDSELSRRRNESKSKNEMAKLLVRQGLDSEAEDHVLSNEEAVEWFNQGVTAGQFAAAQDASIRAQGARDKLESDVNTVLAGGGAALTRDDYENALQRLTQDAVKGMPPEDAQKAAVNIRIEAAVESGREDSKLKALVNAGPAGGEATFAAGLDLRAQIQEQSPELYNKMVDGKARAWYNSYDFMTQNLGIDPGAARARLLEFDENRKETEGRLNSKENKELIDDAVDVDFAGQNIAVQSEIKKRMAGYMALVPTLTAEQAVGLASADFEQSTVEIGHGVRAKAIGVPVKWEDADQFVRHSTLKRDLRDSGIQFDNDDLDDMVFVPNGDGTTSIIGLNGLTIFPRWNWQRAVDEWFVTIGQPDIEAKQRELRQDAIEKERAARVMATIPSLGGR